MEVERVKITRGQSRFILKERLQRQRVAHPNDSVAQDVANVEELEDVEVEVEDFTVQFQGNNLSETRVIPADDQLIANTDPAAPAPQATQKLRAQFGRKRTHNEQVVVAPCGMIIANEKFYGAEAVSSVAVSGNSSITICP